MDEKMELILRGGQFKKLMDEKVKNIREEYDLKKAEVEVLSFLSKCGENNTSTDIRKFLLMNKGHISQAAESLCSRGYLVANPDKNDRRYVHYELTEEARSIVKEVAKIREEMTKEILEGITEEEMVVFKSVSKKISDNITKLL